MSSNTQQQNYYKNTLSNGSVEQKERVWKPRNDYRNNRGGNGQRSFQRHQNYNGNNNQRYNNSYKRGVLTPSDLVIVIYCITWIGEMQVE